MSNFQRILDEDFSPVDNVESFVAKLFSARQQTYNMHLKTKSFAEHKALNDFYDEILDLADEFIETYQGQYGLLNLNFLLDLLIHLL